MTKTWVVAAGKLSGSQRLQSRNHCSIRLEYHVHDHRAVQWAGHSSGGHDVHGVCQNM